MSWETQIARRVFPKDQSYLAKRKFRVMLWTTLVALFASALFIGMMWLMQGQRR